MIIWEATLLVYYEWKIMYLFDQILTFILYAYKVGMNILNILCREEKEKNMTVKFMYFFFSVL